MDINLSTSGHCSHANRQDMSEVASSTIWTAQAIECPKCEARLVFYRSSTPRIDSSGFESYSLECKECGTRLGGIIDPYDEKLLLSELEG